MKKFLFPVMLVMVLCSNAFGIDLVQPPAENPHPPVTAIDKERVRFATEKIRGKYGKNAEIRHVHVVRSIFKKYEEGRKRVSGGDDNGYFAFDPEQSLKLKPDEYVVHAYVLPAKGKPWSHVYVILAEDEKGGFIFRYFYDTPLVDDIHLRC